MSRSSVLTANGYWFCTPCLRFIFDLRQIWFLRYSIFCQNLFSNQKDLGTAEPRSFRKGHFTDFPLRCSAESANIRRAGVPDIRAPFYRFKNLPCGCGAESFWVFFLCLSLETNFETHSWSCSRTFVFRFLISFSHPLRRSCFVAWFFSCLASLSLGAVVTLGGFSVLCRTAFGPPHITLPFFFHVYFFSDFQHFPINTIKHQIADLYVCICIYTYPLC